MKGQKYPKEGYSLITTEVDYKKYQYSFSWSDILLYQKYVDQALTPWMALNFFKSDAWELNKHKCTLITFGFSFEL